jgi:hypothetical protein
MLKSSGQKCRASLSIQSTRVEHDKSNTLHIEIKDEDNLAYIFTSSILNHFV